MGQLDLFQSPGEYETTIFNRARKLKEIVQAICNANSVLFSENKKVYDDVLEDYVILNIEVDIDQIRDKDSPIEPSTPKLFIWQFIPSITLISKEEEGQIVLEKGKSYSEEIGPKIIPKWINELFTTNSFSHGDFLNYTTQYFTLEIIVNLLSDDKFINEIKSACNNRSLVVFFKSKLFSSLKNSSYTLLERDVINKIKNFFSRLKNLQQDNWYFIGSYKDFTSENDLLIDLDFKQTTYVKYKEAMHVNKEKNQLVRSFQNDFLLLNNAEFFFQKTNTDKWEGNCVLSPNLFDESGSKLELKGDERMLYCYMNNENSAPFYRCDLLFPNNKTTSQKLFEILSIAQYLNND